MNTPSVVVAPRWPAAVEASHALADPAEATDDAANLTLMAMLMLARRASDGEQPVRNGSPVLYGSVRTGAYLAGQTIGLIGFDAVAREVARRAHHGFGMRVLVHEPAPLDAEDASTSDITWCTDLDELLAEADYVALRSSGEGLGSTIDARRLDQMKPSAFLIGTLNGRAIDHQALVHALWFETIAGVALRVDPNQPKMVADLAACPNALMLVHRH